ncbi:unnamed protein product [Clonostachys byssicola]|uniref:Nucleoside phosphorylase domain-containing protein n=1 Tax=Clonostachys byssicola TaxID=160290 RepID=A0A9N9Y9K3_9HYPO|nr:unnamed protein product [Clonostachys byssicola]
MKEIEALLAKIREGAYVKGPDVSEYKIAILCALRDEIIATCSFLEERYDPESIDVDARDFNRYKLGKLAGRYVVVVQMPETGKSPATATATHLARTFENVKLLLMVGIGGGIPVEQDRVRVHVGDVVVSSPQGRFGAVFEHDRGKAHSGGVFEHTGHLNNPPPFAISIANDLDMQLSENLDLLEKMRWKISLRRTDPDLRDHQSPWTGSTSHPSPTPSKGSRVKKSALSYTWSRGITETEKWPEHI